MCWVLQWNKKNVRNEKYHEKCNEMCWVLQWNKKNVTKKVTKCVGCHSGNNKMLRKTLRKI